MISIREHCIPAYDEIHRVNEVQPLPDELGNMEQKTSGGIVMKVKAILDSVYFQQLPNTATIKSGGYLQFQWNKETARKEMNRIWDECKNFL